MKENKYDNPSFFEKYSQMERSTLGLEGAGEWHQLRPMLPDFTGKRVLDLGCGFGWHVIYAMEQGASSAVGVDLSSSMLEIAREKTKFANVEYILDAIENLEFPPDSFDVIISSLTFHYIEDYDKICRNIFTWLKAGGSVVFSVEHPVFTAHGSQDWCYDAQGEILHWPVDNYYTEGQRKAVFLGEEITKYHRTLSTYVGGVTRAGFQLVELVEAQPDPTMLDSVEGMRHELRRPMMLLLSAKKN